MVRGQFALAIVADELRDGNSLWAQVRVIEIDFPAQHRDLEERRRFVGELYGRTDHHPSMFPLAISSCLSPSKFPNIGTAQTSGSHDTSVLHKVSFSAFGFGQPGLLGRTVIVANEGEPEVRTDGNRMAVMFCALARLRPEQTGTTFQFLRRESADSADGPPLCCGDVPWIAPDLQDKRWREQSLPGKPTSQSALRDSQDNSMHLMACGYRVFVCSNIALRAPTHSQIRDAFRGFRWS